MGALGRIQIIPKTNGQDLALLIRLARNIIQPVAVECPA